MQNFFYPGLPPGSSCAPNNMSSSFFFFCNLHFLYSIRQLHTTTRQSSTVQPPSIILFPRVLSLRRSPGNCSLMACSAPSFPSYLRGTDPNGPFQRHSAGAENILLPCLGGMTNERKKAGVMSNQGHFSGTRTSRRKEWGADGRK